MFYGIAANFEDLDLYRVDLSQTLPLSLQMNYDYYAQQAKTVVRLFANPQERMDIQRAGSYQHPLGLFIDSANKTFFARVPSDFGRYVSWMKMGFGETQWIHVKDMTTPIAGLTEVPMHNVF